MHEVRSMCDVVPAAAAVRDLGGRLCSAQKGYGGVFGARRLLFFATAESLSQQPSRGSETSMGGFTQLQGDPCTVYGTIANGSLSPVPFGVKNIELPLWLTPNFLEVTG